MALCVRDEKLIEGVFSLVAAIIEGVVALITAAIEAIAGLFAVGGEALTAGEAIATFIALIIEVILWVILWLIELVVSLFTWRKPRKVKKPVIWRSKKRTNNEKNSDNNT